MREGRGPDSVPLAMEAEEFRRLGRELVDRIADHMEGLPDRRVTPGNSPREVREALGSDRSLPSQGMDPEDLLRAATDLLLSQSLFNGHPRFFGYITAGPAPIGVLADLLAAGVNPNVGAWTLAPMATEIEAQTVRWIAELIGFPSDCGGLLVSGGNVANFVGLLAARAWAGKDWEIRRTGLNGAGPTRLRVYGSTETHTWIEKATDIFGLGTDACRVIPTDPEQRMDPDALRRQVKQDRTDDLRPFLVVGTAGSTSTGAVDPLGEIADFCREEALWFHVDGAYGGFAASVPQAPDELAELSRADSVAVDPHKWLYSPLEAGCVLVRDPGVLREAFSYHPPYYHFGAEATNFVDLGPQNSRGFRALKVWLGLKQVGREGYLRMISEDIELARHLHTIAADHPELEAMAQGLSVSVVRYVPEELRLRRGDADTLEYLNGLNREIQDRMERGGEAFVSGAVVGGRYGLRACIVNFNTTRSDVEALPGIITRVGREVHEEKAG